MLINRLQWFLTLSLMVSACERINQIDQELLLGTFGAFHTKINSGEDFEQFSRTGDYADIVVDLGHDNFTFTFWRGSSYLPYLATPAGKFFVDEVIPRAGDGEGMRPDLINAYSNVKIIENSPDKVIIHWRYLPEFSGKNPITYLDAKNFVDEYFVITPDLKVKRTIRKGTEKSDDWWDPKNRIVQTFDLRKSGIEHMNTIEASPSDLVKSVSGSPVTDQWRVDPLAWWRFDEGQGDRTLESVSGASSEIIGHKSLWKKGISGTALQFDGYNTVIEYPAKNAPVISNGLTLEAWIAIGAYPWNWTPIVQQGDDRGYFLGLDGYGHPAFKVMIGDKWEELISDITLERNSWYNLAGTFDGKIGLMNVYIDGKLSGSKKVDKENVSMAGEIIKIGMGKDRKPTNPAFENTFQDSYGFDGLIDEVRIYDRALTTEEIQSAYSHMASVVAIKEEPDMEVRRLPVFDGPGSFGASYTHLRYYETWDNLWRFGEHPDIVVSFDELPTQFVFWRGTGYIPMLVNDKGQWYSNEFNETWSTSGGQGCQEPMSDKGCYSNHARILENTDARVVIHWRYPLVDVLYVTANMNEDTGWGDWCDWYYYIYPDGVATKIMHLWTDGKRNHEWQESMAITGPNQHPEDIVETDVTMTMVDLEGNFVEYGWEGGLPGDVDEPVNKVIQHLNYKADFDPVTIGDFQGSDVYGGGLTPYAVFPTWNHWPVGLMPSDGRYASFPDRAASSYLTHLYLPTYAEDFGDRPFQEKILMEGMIKENPLDLIPLAKSWLDPPGVSNMNGCESTGYDKGQRAFVLYAVADEMSIQVEASEDHPLYNPGFVIKNWTDNSPSILAVNGKRMAPGSDVRQGVIRDTDGTWTMVVWFRLESEEPVEFAFGNK